MNHGVLEQSGMGSLSRIWVHDFYDLRLYSVWRMPVQKTSTNPLPSRPSNTFFFRMQNFSEELELNLAASFTLLGTPFNIPFFHQTLLIWKCPNSAMGALPACEHNQSLDCQNEAWMGSQRGKLLHSQKRSTVADMRVRIFLGLIATGLTFHTQRTC